MDGSKMKKLRQPNDQSSSLDQLLLRLSQTLQDLPPALRRDIVRRHPYYQQFWQAAKRHHAGADKNPKVREYNRFAAIVMQIFYGIARHNDPEHRGPRHVKSQECDWTSSRSLNFCFAKIGVAGLEPARSFDQRILSPLRLPIPPRPGRFDSR